MEFYRFDSYLENAIHDAWKDPRHNQRKSYIFTRNNTNGQSFFYAVSYTDDQGDIKKMYFKNPHNARCSIPFWKDKVPVKYEWVEVKAI